MKKEFIIYWFVNINKNEHIKKITKGSAVTVDSDKTSCERSKMILLLSNMGLI